MNQSPINAIQVDNQKFVIARDADFNDFLECTPKPVLHRAIDVLKEHIGKFGETRSPAKDFYCQRLAQTRKFLQLS